VVQGPGLRGAPAGAPAGADTGFGNALAGQISKLEGLQTEATDGARSLADGTASDPSSVVVAVERARLAMQLAAQIRTKSVEAINDVMHTQV
jgi:flagellar hook-basal body complex protein FliE